MKLRPEVLRFPRDDGGLDLLDLLFDRLVSLGPDEAAALAAEAPDEASRAERGEAPPAAPVPREVALSIEARLRALDLVESPGIEAMRRDQWASRVRGKPARAAAGQVAAVDWEEARALPPLVAAAWREPERLRRLAEERAAGRRYLQLPGFVAPDAAAPLAAAAAALPFARLDTELVHADRKLLDGDELAEWRALMAAPSLRRLLGAVLGVELPEKIFVNAWRLRGDDLFAVHPDGRLYRGTLSLGLNAGWTAADGGAIAFGDPTPAGFVVRERWLPHLGDALLFAPDRTTFHAVEPVLSKKTRLSLTGWWTAPG